MSETLIDLIRHGEPVGGSRYRGSGIDDPLSEKGWTQMWRAVGDHAPWSQIVTSPLRRCRTFAEALGERHGLPVKVEEDFREVGFGAWEGLDHAAIKEGQAQEYQAFLDDPLRNRPPGAEPLEAFIERTCAALERSIAAHRGGHLLIVCHAGVIRALAGTVVEASPRGIYRIKVTNGGITRLRHDGRRLVLEGLNVAL